MVVDSPMKDKMFQLYSFYNHLSIIDFLQTRALLYVKLELLLRKIEHEYELYVAVMSDSDWIVRRSYEWEQFPVFIVVSRI